MKSKSPKFKYTKPFQSITLRPVTRKAVDAEIKKRMERRVCMADMIYLQLRGFAVAFKDGNVEYWKYDPSVLNKKQLKALGIHKWAAFQIEIK